MTLITPAYRKLNRQLHETRPDYGADHFGWSRYARTLVEGNGYRTVLDYGCGKGNLAKALADTGADIREYDPAIPGKTKKPAPAELVTCTDVLEHIEPACLDAVLRDLRRVTERRLFVTIYTKPSRKTLADGRNAHLLVKDGAWWRAKLLRYFRVLAWAERGPTVAAELVAKPRVGRQKRGKRRPLTPEMDVFIKTLQAQINIASDDFSQLRTTAMFECVGDEPADLQVSCDVLEDQPDIEAAIASLALNTRKAAYIGVKLSHLVTEWDWIRAIEQRFRIAQTQRLNRDGVTRLLVTASPGLSVQGVTAVGAVASDDRWTQVEAACKLFPKRVELSQRHGRRAVVACYGPSLAGTLDQLAALRCENVDVISVSGAHDYLLRHGITPRFHIECDPRAHKADNIAAGVDGVTYLMASCCHERMLDKVADQDVRLWHVATIEHAPRLTEAGESPKHMISGGGSVGLRAIPLLYAMGYRDLSFFGMDCSFSDDGEAQWAGPHAGKRQDVVECDCGGRIFMTSPVLLTYATNFFESVQKAPDLNVKLYGDGLLQHWARLQSIGSGNEEAA